MQQLTIISGKGGTGKTVVTASLATLVRKKVIVDCDVDAANLHLLLHPEVRDKHQFKGGEKAYVDIDKCVQCGACLNICRFDAITKNKAGVANIDPLSCEGCGLCSYNCPVQAIEMRKCISGEWFLSRTKYGPFVHAKLGIGEENSGKLVSEIRIKAKEIADQDKLDFVIIDGPPGIGCPVIASLTGTDLALVVTEPTLSAIHDMKRVVQMARHFGTQTACCINKYDLNLKNTRQIEIWCKRNSIPFLGKISFDEEVAKSIVLGIPLTEHTDNSVSREIKTIWKNLKQLCVAMKIDGIKKKLAELRADSFLYSNIDIAKQ